MPSKSSSKTRKATYADADLTLKLYDLRRENEMRKARNYMVMQFNPQSAAEAIAIVQAFGSQENAWLRQVLGYWDMAASMVNQGVLHPDMFYASTGEPYLLFAKFEPYLGEIRRAIESPGFMAQLEKTVNCSQAGRDRMALMRKRAAQRRAAAAK